MCKPLSMHWFPGSLRAQSPFFLTIGIDPPPKIIDGCSPATSVKTKAFIFRELQFQLSRMECVPHIVPCLYMAFILKIAFSGSIDLKTFLDYFLINYFQSTQGRTQNQIIRVDGERNQCGRNNFAIGNYCGRKRDICRS